MCWLRNNNEEAKSTVFLKIDIYRDTNNTHVTNKHHCYDYEHGKMPQKTLEQVKWMYLFQKTFLFSDFFLQWICNNPHNITGNKQISNNAEWKNPKM